MKGHNTFKDIDLLSFSIFSLIFSFGLAYFSIHFFLNSEIMVFPILLGLSSLGFLFTSFFVLSKWKKVKDFHIKELEKKQRNDLVTQIPSSTFFEIELKKSILAHKLNSENNNNNDEDLYLLIINVDRFSFMNDTFGYNFGDQVLVRIKDELSSVLDETDIIGKLSSSEFGIITLKRNDELLSFVKNISSLFGKNFKISNTENDVFLNIIIGVSSYSGMSDNPDHNLLLHKSKVALNAAKKEYNCRFKIHNQTLEPNTKKDLSLEKDLRNSIINKELFVVFQPKVDLKSNKVIGSEALVRWFSKSRNTLIRPDIFIPIAEDIGFISEIGNFVLNESLKELNIWHSKGLTDLKVAVNVSTKQFNLNLPALIGEYIENHKINPKMLELEVTESAVVSDHIQGLNILHKFKELGVSIAIDDFGTGYSSLSYLITFPLDVVKIDKSFIDKLIDKDETTKLKGSAVVSAVIHLAHKIDCIVVAEGVEHLEQIDNLMKENCDIIQGYYYSEPLNKDKFIDFVINFNSK